MSAVGNLTRKAIGPWQSALVWIQGTILYVGNEPKDGIGANRAGMRSALIDRGSKSIEHGQNVTIKSLSDLFILVD